MEKNKRAAQKILYLVKVLYTPVSIGFIVYFAYHNWATLQKMAELADWTLLLVSIGTWCFLHTLAPVLPRLILNSFGTSISYSNLLAIHISRLPARYLPGGIWHTVGRISAYYSFGVSKKNLTVLTLVETLFPCIITLSLGGSYLWLIESNSTLSSLEGVLALINLVALIAIPLFVKWKMPLSWNKNFLRVYILYTILSIFYWTVAALSFLGYYTSLSFDINTISLLKVAATYIFSWGIGYISIFAPQGIGIFEVVAGKLLTLPLNLGGAVAFMAGFRIVVLIADCITWTSYMSCLFIYKKKTKHQPEL